MIIVIINKRKLNKENVNVFESLYFFLFNHTTIVISACVEEGRPVFDRAIPKQNFTLQNPFFMIIFTYFEYLQSHFCILSKPNVYIVF